MKSYASFFEWHSKGQKELGVVEELLAALNSCSARQLRSLREFAPDPPDCVCETTGGEVVAVEVAEVVCQRATELNAQGSQVYRVWRTGELAAHVSSVLARKDTKHFNGGPYSAVIASLFTDEPALSEADARAELLGATFGPYKQLTEGYLLFSYQPSSKSYPFIRLSFAP